MKAWWLAAAAAALLVQPGRPAAARDHIMIVSSWASLRFTKAVAERVAQEAGGPAPVVEHTSTGLGFTFLCSGGADQPDAASVTRRMRKSELDDCRKNGVSEVVEIPVGLDVLVIAQSKAGPALRLTRAQMFVALAKELPDEAGHLGPNPHRRWSDVDARLPDVRIDVRVLPRPSGSREALQDLFLAKGAETIPEIAKRWAQDGKAMRALREDNPFVSTEDSEQAIARELIAHPDALGVFSYAFLRANKATLRGVPVDGAEPTPENAYSGKYPGARRLYLYVNKARIGSVRGLNRLAAEFVSSAALGPGGYLLAQGFLPLGVDDMAKTMGLVNAMPVVQREELPD
jgi:phosphate transport system substrate-binding protein